MERNCDFKVISRQLQLVSYPKDAVTAENFEIVEVELPEISDGEVLVRNTWTSVDPALRVRLREKAPQGYFPAFPLGQAMDAIFAAGVVEQSKAPEFPVGSTVWHSYGWRTYAVVKADEVAMNGVGNLRKLDLEIAPANVYLGLLGSIGLTAYTGLHLIDALDAKGTIWVSAGAGAVGTLVAQIAKNVGLRVVASAGTDEKVRWLVDEIGVDAAFNWRDGSLNDSLEVAAPEGLDFYFDSVGGEHLEAALFAMNNAGKIALCGAISEYEGEPQSVRNLFMATSKNLTLRGFRASAHTSLLAEMQKRLGGWYAEGKIHYRETVFEGLESTPIAMAEMMAGRTVGKTIVHIGD